MHLRARNLARRADGFTHGARLVEVPANLVSKSPRVGVDVPQRASPLGLGIPACEAQFFGGPHAGLLRQVIAPGSSKLVILPLPK